MEAFHHKKIINSDGSFTWSGKKYLISDEEPQNGDLVLTQNYGVWIFQDLTGTGTAPLPYWANKKLCKKLILITGE
jgi:hypothetical protein